MNKYDSRNSIVSNGVYGYIFNYDGTHEDKIVFEGTPKNIASFIYNNRNYPVIVTDAMDRLIVSSSIGGYIDRIGDVSIRDELLKEIMKLQVGD